MDDINIHCALGEGDAPADGSSLTDGHLPPPGDRPDATCYSDRNY